MPPGYNYSAHLVESIDCCLRKEPDARPDLKGLLAMPLVAAHAAELEAATIASVAAALQVDALLSSPLLSRRRVSVPEPMKRGRAAPPHRP